MLVAAHSAPFTKKMWRLACVLMLTVLAGCTDDELGLNDMKVTIVEMVRPTDASVPHDARLLNSQDAGVLKIGLSTNSSLEMLIMEQSLNLAVDVFFCADPKNQALALSYLYDKDGVPFLPGLRSETKTKAVSGTIAYSYVAIAASPWRDIDNGVQHSQYDLREVPTEICVSVRGSRMIGRQLRSNTVRISAGAVGAALVH